MKPNLSHQGTSPALISPWGRELNLEQTRVMGVINITPDSFYAGSSKETLKEILTTADEMLLDGADIIDLGAMSTRPGSDPINSREEKEKIVQAVTALRKHFPRAMLSIDTYRADVAQQGLAAGADIINDISGFAFDTKLVEVASREKAPYILMHIKGTPKNMQRNPHYDDLMAEILSYFQQKIEYLLSQGMEEHNIVIDPGLGFGKRFKDNMELLDQLTILKSLNKPVLIGASRKSFIGTALALDSPKDRLIGTVAITSLCAYQGIELIRVHDVKENVQAIKMMEAIKCRRP